MTTQRLVSMMAGGLAVFPLLIAGSTALAATYYVTVGGDDGNGATGIGTAMADPLFERFV